MIPTENRLFDAIDATWPAARQVTRGPWILRDGQGGGKRVSAASATGPVTPKDIAIAEQAMRDMGQDPLFMLRAHDTALDDALAGRGYQIVDPVQVLAAPVARLTSERIPSVTTFEIWEPLAIMAEIWAKGGIGPARLDVMARAEVKTAILARWNQKPAGVGFAALHGDIAMVHAVEVLAEQRRQGVAGWIMRQAAFWAQAQAAETLSVLCTRANTAATGLYSALGFVPAGQYHYRAAPKIGDGPHD